MQRNQLVSEIDQYLEARYWPDYGPNGLQVEGNETIKHIVFAVSATKESIEFCVEQKADTLIVHHGLFWKFHGPRAIVGPFAKRVKPLIENNINLLGYHLPLDAHPEVGNAALLAKKIGLSQQVPFGDYKGNPTGVAGKFQTPINPNDLKKQLEGLLSHSILHSCPSEIPMIESMAIITGGANGDWSLAARKGYQSYLTGEMSEHDWHEAKESGIHAFAGGHNATEQFGIQGLQNWVQSKWPQIKTTYFSSLNPA